MEIKKRYLGIVILILLIPLASSVWLDVPVWHILFEDNNLLILKSNSIGTNASNNTFYIPNNVNTGNISAPYFEGNGSLLTDVTTEPFNSSTIDYVNHTQLNNGSIIRVSTLAQAWY